MLSYISFKFPNVENVHCAFQTRGQVLTNDEYSSGNISLEVNDEEQRVISNRKSICSTFKVDSFSEAKQVHGIKTIFDPQNADYASKTIVEADGLASTRKNHALCIKTADCQPILFCDTKGEHLLAIHSGWRGNRQDYPLIAVKEFTQKYNLDPKNLLAVRGPSLSPQVSEFINYNSEWGEEFNTWYNAKNKTVDLWQLTKAQLINAGLEKENIYSIDLCTYSNNHMFFSYRREHKSGRQGSFIWKY